MKTTQIAVEAAKQIRGKIVDLTGVSLDYRNQWLENIIKSAIEKAIDWKDRELEGLRQQNEAYRTDNLRLRQSRAVHASEQP